MGNIKNVPFIERPYEKAKIYGISSLSDSELLSIIINTGTKEKSALEIAQELIKQNNSLKFLIESSIEELCEIKGIGLVKAIELKAVGEITKRILKIQPNNVKIKSGLDVFNLIGNEMRYEENEILKIILLNNQNNILKIKDIAVGSESNIALNIKQIFKEAVKTSSPKMILVHNHPSGNTTPSNLDIEFTLKVRKVANLLDIELLDHIIIGNNGYESI